MSDSNATQGREFSPLSHLFSQNDITVEVTIFRASGSTGGWMLEVFDSDENAVVWDEPFASDHEAHDEFYALVEERGLLDVMNPADVADGDI